MGKYYIERPSYLHDNLSKWDLILDNINMYGVYIEVIEKLMCFSDKEFRMKIQQLLTNDVSYFKRVKPIDRTISLSPFIHKTDYISVCFKYEINDKLIDELKTNWLDQLKEELVVHPFIVFSDKIPILWVNYSEVVILLDVMSKKLFQKNGFKLEEYDISLNEALYRIMPS